MSVDDEAKSRLTSVLSVLESEMEALEALRDARLDGALEAMVRLRAEIVAALASLEQPPTSGSG